MSSPRHSPPPSADAPKPRGILKNAISNVADVVDSSRMPVDQSAQMNEDQNRLAWDEGNLILHEIERQQQDPRMKIDEPKTPFVHSASLGTMNDEFDLDASQQATDLSTAYFGPFEPSHSTRPDGPSNSRRSSAADVLAANTKANALGSAGRSEQSEMSSTSTHDEDLHPLSRARRGPNSRSPSFTLPGSRRSSAGERSREEVREELRNRGGQSENGSDTGLNEAIEEYQDGKEGDPDEKAKQDAFTRKRNAHYGNEAEAMKIAAALAAQEDEDEEDEDQEEKRGQGSEGLNSNSTFGTVPLPNGR